MKIHYGIIIIMCCLLNACQPASQNPRIYDSGISQELAELRKQEINELKYDLRLSIPKQKSMPVEGEIHVRFRLNKAQEVILDFREEADKIKEVSANGLPTSYEFRNEHIILPKNTTQKGENDIYIRFTAGNQSLNRNDEFLYTLLVPDRARTVFPCFEQPNLKASFTLQLNIPSEWEGKKKILQALTGVEKMAQNVDALLVINNQRLFDIYPELSLIDAFGKADDTLSVAAKSIAEIITMHGIINLDFNDVKTVLKDGGVALMSTGFGKGEDRLKKAIENALHSPLLNDNDVFNSKKILLSVSFSSEGEDKKNELMMDEMKAINEFMDGFDDDIETKWGVSIDPELKENVKVTILATGFGMKVEDGKMNITDKNEQSVEEMRKTRQKKDAEDALIDSYYGKGGNNKERPQVRCFIFGNDDLDNDNLISAIESMPTYSRSRTQNNELIKLSKGDVDSVSQTKVGTTTSGTIKFA